jgi:integrase/recombinase XerD
MKGPAIILHPHDRDELLETVPFVSTMPARDNLVFACSFFEAMRVCEIAGLEIDTLLGPRGEILDFIRIAPHTTKRNGARTIEMHSKVRRALEEFLDVYPTAQCVAISPRDGKQMNAAALGRAMERIYEAAGFSGCRSHTGRASCITEMATLANLYGCNLADVQRFAGHRRIETTAGYIGSTGRIGSLVEALGNNTQNERRRSIEPSTPGPTYWEGSRDRSNPRRKGRSTLAREPHPDGHGRRNEELLAIRADAKHRARRKLRQNRPARRDR